MHSSPLDLLPHRELLLEMSLARFIFFWGAKRAKQKSSVCRHTSDTFYERKHNDKNLQVLPPEGKDYGVNTILQTNLVDARGHIVKGVNKGVPIRVPPSSAELRNAKTRYIELTHNGAGHKGSHPFCY